MANELLIPKISPSQVRELPLQSPVPGKSRGTGFDSVFKDALNSKAHPDLVGKEPALKFSAHALNRIKDRSISMGADLLARLDNAVNTAAQKGAKESLILSDDAAFIVSVKNRTVITVVDRNQVNGNVFTNIDSTVVI